MADKSRYTFPVLVNTFPYATVESKLMVNPNTIGAVGIIIVRDIKINVNVVNRNPEDRKFDVDACIVGNSKNTADACESQTVHLEGNSDETLEFIFKVPNGNYTFVIKTNTDGKTDEFTRTVSVHEMLPQFIELPHVGETDIATVAIAIFLLATMLAVFLIKRR